MKQADKARMQAIKDSGCILTLLATNQYSQAPDVHHLTDCGRRRGHQATIGASPYHHRGLIPDGYSKQTISGLLGPSYAWGKRGFHEFFGPDDLLLEIQDLVLGEFKAYPWPDYQIPEPVRHATKLLWTSKRSRLV